MCVWLFGSAGSSVVERSIAARRVTGSNPVSRSFFVRSRVQLAGLCVCVSVCLCIGVSVHRCIGASVRQCISASVHRCVALVLYAVRCNMTMASSTACVCCVLVYVDVVLVARVCGCAWCVVARGVWLWCDVG